MFHIIKTFEAKSEILQGVFVDVIPKENTKHIVLSPHKLLRESSVYYSTSFAHVEDQLFYAKLLKISRFALKCGSTEF